MANTDKKDLHKLLDKFMFDDAVTDDDNDSDNSMKTDKWETDIVALDSLLYGGLPKGKAIAIGTEHGAGKTTMMIQACGNIVEKYNKSVYYLDIEGGATFELISDMGYADLLYHPKNNPTGKFYLLSLSTIQEVARVLKQVSKDDDTAVVVIDSDSAVVDQRDLDDDTLGTENKAAAINARMWSSAAHQFLAVIKNSKMCFVFLHQARVNIQGFKPKVEATGSRAIKHIVSAEIWGKRRSWIDSNCVPVKSQKDASGAYVEFTTIKNRFALPFTITEAPIFFGRGVSNLWAYRDWLYENTFTDSSTGEDRNYITRKGSWFEIALPFYTGKVQGEPAVISIIQNNYDDIIKLVADNGGFKPKVSASAGTAFDEEEDD